MGSWGKKIQNWLGRLDEGGNEFVAADEPDVSSASQESSAADPPPAVSEEPDTEAAIAMLGADESVDSESAVVAEGDGCVDAGSAVATEPCGSVAADSRFSPRIEHFGWARFSADGVEGEGLVINLSQGGALVERVTEPLAAGTKFTLRLKPSGGFETLDLDAEVVREIDGGFAFRFLSVDTDALAVLREVISRYTSEG